MRSTIPQSSQKVAQCRHCSPASRSAHREWRMESGKHAAPGSVVLFPKQSKAEPERRRRYGGQVPSAQNPPKISYSADNVGKRGSLNSIDAFTPRTLTKPSSPSSHLASLKPACPSMPREIGAMETSSVGEQNFCVNVLSKHPWADISATRPRLMPAVRPPNRQFSDPHASVRIPPSPPNVRSLRIKTPARNRMRTSAISPNAETENVLSIIVGGRGQI